MKKLIIILFTLLSVVARGTDYYVKTGGNDGLSGTSDANAWATIAKVNAIWNAGTFAPGDNIYFNRGDTFVGTVTVKESGSSGNVITIGAYGTGADPVITGFTTLVSWSSYGSGIYSKAISCESAANMVTVDGAITPMGRYPDTGWRYYESHSGNTSITDNQLSGSPDWDGAEIVISPNAWTIYRRTILTHTNTTITFASIPWDLYDNYGYFIQKDIRLLDNILGEWFYNGSTMYMYFGATDPATKAVKVASLNYLLSISGYDYITIDNIDFQGANTNAIYLSNADHVTIQNCNVSFAGTDAIAGSGSTYLIVDNCVIEEINSNGISLNSGCTYATITDNTIENIGLLHGLTVEDHNYWTCRGISTYAEHTTIERNNVLNTGYIGIYGVANYIDIENNFVNGCGLRSLDGGGIYTSGIYSGGYYTNVNILNNIVLNGGVGSTAGTPPGEAGWHGFHGIYLDDHSQSVTVTGNTAANCTFAGIFLHNAKNNTVTYNLSYNNTEAAIMFSHDPGMGEITGNVINNNKYIAKSASQRALRYQSANGGVSSFATSNYNYYARPIDDDDVFVLYVESSLYYTLAQWKTYSGQDANSLGSPINIASVNDLYFYYNASAIDDSVFTLDVPCIDFEGTKYNSTVTLDGWESVVLLKDPDPDEDPPEAAVVTTSLVVQLGNGTAIGGGTVSDEGTISARGLCWNTTGSPTTADNKTTDGTGAGAFTSKMNGLARNKIYYIRAYATNEVATSYGYQVTYSTHGRSGFINGKVGFINGKRAVIY